MKKDVFVTKNQQLHTHIIFIPLLPAKKSLASLLHFYNILPFQLVSAGSWLQTPYSTAWWADWEHQMRLKPSPLSDHRVSAAVAPSNATHRNEKTNKKKYSEVEPKEKKTLICNARPSIHLFHLLKDVSTTRRRCCRVGCTVYAGRRPRAETLCQNHYFKFTIHGMQSPNIEISPKY